MFIYLFVFLVAQPFSLALAASLPAGIKPCKNDEKLNDCALSSANEAIKAIVKGIPAFKIPVMDPLRVERISLAENPGQSVSLNLTLKNLDIYGLSKASFIKSEMDVKKQHVKWTFKTPQARMISDYEVNGKFLVVPITGKGKATIIIEDPVFTYDFDYTVAKKNGKDFLVVGKDKLSYTPKNIKVNLENLFNGNKALGTEVNKMLNDNWTVLNDSLGPGIAQALAAAGKALLNNIVTRVPFDEIFLPS